MQPVAMQIERSAIGSDLHIFDGAAPDSFSRNVACQMAADTEASKLTPEAVAQKIHQVITSEEKPLRVPMDRAKGIRLVKRFAPQWVVDRRVGEPMKSASSKGPGSF